MQSKAKSVEDYMNELPNERREVLQRLRDVIKKNLPKGFKEEMNYGMIGYVVPHDIYPKGYHCDPKLPLPFMNIASQKNFVGLYHMGIYSDENLLKWFQEEYKKVVPTKLDMGKSCVRLKKMETIPYKLIGELASKVTVEDWVAFYEESMKK